MFFSGYFPTNKDELRNFGVKLTNLFTSFRTSILEAVYGFFYLFFSKKFIVHRVVGFSYLVQYLIVIYLYFADYEKLFLTSPLIITLPLTGVLQSVIAIYTFTFLPKYQSDPGYYSDKSTLSYAFIKENSFYAGILAFQWLYYNDNVFPYIRKFYIIEILFVFLPYLFRGTSFFPRTSI